MIQQLFTGRPLPTYLDAHGARMLRLADKLPPLAWQPTGPDQPALTDHAVAEQFLRDIAIVVPIVEWTSLKYATSEAVVPHHAPGSTTLQQVHGVRLTATVPYLGDRNLLTCRPTEHGTAQSSHSVTVRPGIGEQGHIVSTFEGRHLHIEEVQRDLETLGLRIVEHLNYARADIDRYRERIIPELLDTITRRRQLHDALDDLERRSSDQ